MVDFEEIEEEQQLNNDDQGEEGSAQSTTLAFRLSMESYVKLFLHAAKHPADDIHGILLGNKSGNNVQVSDYVPLFHTPVFSPMLDIALLAIEEYCASAQTGTNTTQIVGWYTASSRNNYSGIPTLAKRIATKLRSQPKALKESCLAVLDNKSFAEEGKLGIDFYHGEKLQDSRGGSVIGGLDSASKMLTTLLAQDVHKKLVDFDDFMQDCSLDWRNTGLVPS